MLGMVDAGMSEEIIVQYAHITNTHACVERRLLMHGGIGGMDMDESTPADYEGPPLVMRAHRPAAHATAMMPR